MINFCYSASLLSLKQSVSAIKLYIDKPKVYKSDLCVGKKRVFRKEYQLCALVKYEVAMPNLSGSWHKLDSQNSSCLIPIPPPKIYNFDIQCDDDVDSLK